MSPCARTAEGALGRDGSYMGRGGYDTMRAFPTMNICLLWNAKYYEHLFTAEFPIRETQREMERRRGNERKKKNKTIFTCKQHTQNTQAHCMCEHHVEPALCLSPHRNMISSDVVMLQRPAVMQALWNTQLKTLVLLWLISLLIYCFYCLVKNVIAPLEVVPAYVFSNPRRCQGHNV